MFSKVLALRGGHGVADGDVGVAELAVLVVLALVPEQAILTCFEQLGGTRRWLAIVVEQTVTGRSQYHRVVQGYKLSPGASVNDRVKCP